VNPDLIYGTSEPNALIITSYRFSTGTSVPIMDTTRCAMQPPLLPGPAVVSDGDVSLSLDDTRISISDGGPQFVKHMFVVVYDKRLGCRWYNTQTGQIGGKWGATGTATIATPYLIRHAYLARSGKYVVIGTNWAGWFVWDLATLNVSHCVLGMDCYGYGRWDITPKSMAPLYSMIWRR
jgi:hypothetical protein